MLLQNRIVRIMASAILFMQLLLFLQNKCQIDPKKELLVKEGVVLKSSSQSVSEMEGVIYNESYVLPPGYISTPRMMDPIDEITCAMKGQYPFLMHRGGIVDWVCKNEGEIKVTHVMIHVFSKYCMDSSSNEGLDDRVDLMLDIGSNYGYYGLLAMKMGCHALLFDLQPGCQRLINNAIVVNQFQDLGRVVPFGVSDVDASFLVPSSTCGGRFPAEAHERGRFDQGDSIAHIKPLSKFIGYNQKVAMAKIDTEGNERHVLEGAKHYFSRHLIRNAVVEVTPCCNFWSNVNVTRDDVARSFYEIGSFGYTAISLHDWSVYTSPEEMRSFILNATFDQSDVWLTLDNVDEQVLGAVQNPNIV